VQSGGGGLQSLVGRVMCRGSKCGGPWVSANCEELEFTGLSDRVDVALNSRCGLSLLHLGVTEGFLVEKQPQ